MRISFLLLVAIVALLHIYIAWFEIFAWVERGPKVFSTLPADLFPATTQLAANQGVYNAFLAAGLIWALMVPDRTWQRRIAACFLLFVFLAGAFVAITIELRPGLFQMVPSAAALIALIFDKEKSRRA